MASNSRKSTRYTYKGNNKKVENKYANIYQDLSEKEDNFNKIFQKLNFLLLRYISSLSFSSIAIFINNKIQFFCFIFLIFRNIILFIMDITDTF